MRPLYLLSIINVALIMVSCTSQKPPFETNPTALKPTTPTPITCSHKDPINVALLTHEKPSRPYTVLGEATISKYNPVGIKRQEAVMRDLMRQMAASLNGDAIINVTSNEKNISATIIAYQPIIV